MEAKQSTKQMGELFWRSFTPFGCWTHMFQIMVGEMRILDSLGDELGMLVCLSLWNDLIKSPWSGVGTSMLGKLVRSHSLSYVYTGTHVLNEPLRDFTPRRHHKHRFQLVVIGASTSSWLILDVLLTFDLIWMTGSLRSHKDIDVSHPEFFATAKVQGYTPPNTEVLISLLLGHSQ